MQRLSRTRAQFQLAAGWRSANTNIELAWRYALLCVLAHVICISLSLVPGARLGSLADGDAITYIWPAQNLVQHGAFSREPHAPYVWEPYRTPGYPILIAISLVLFGDYSWTLFLAALSAGLAGWAAVRLVQLWGGGRAAQHLAGFAVAVLPNSLGLSAFLLTDAMFGHFTLVWVYCLIHGWSGSSRRWLAASVVVLLLLQALKPTMNAGALILVLVAALYVRQRRQLIAACLLVALSVPLPAYFAMRNAADHGVFQPTLLGVETVREYLQSRYLAEQSGVDYSTMTARIRADDRAAAAQLTQPESIYGRLYRVKQAQVTRFFREAPIAAARLMSIEAVRQLVAPQEFVVLVFNDTPPFWLRGLGSLLSMLIWAAAVYGGWGVYKRGDWRPALLVAGLLVFFLVSGSVSTLVGARLRFPADMAALPLAALGGARLRQRISFGVAHG